MTLPKLELSGATLLAKLMKKVKLALEIAIKIDSVNYYTDSTIVLCWLRSPYKKYEVYVANRISQILQTSDSNSWNHTKTSDNSADLVTHGIHPDQLKSNSLWFYGPKFLQSSPYNWPCTTDILETQTDVCQVSEISASSHATTVVSDTFNDDDVDYFMKIFERFSSFQKLLNTMAKMLQILLQLKVKIKIYRSTYT